MELDGAQDVTEQSPLDLDRLTTYLTAVPEIASKLPIRSAHRIGEGQSNLTFRMTLQGGSVILRRPPIGPLPPRAHDVLREYRVIRALQGSSVPVPHAIIACPDPDIIGAPFFLMDDLPGDAIRFSLPYNLAAWDGAQGSIARQVIEALATLHTTEPAAVHLDDLSRPTGYIERQVRLWKGQLDYARVRPVPELDWVSSWLEANLPCDVYHPSIVHGDYKLDNSIFTLEPPPRLLAIVDWEMAALGDPLADLGWLLAFWCENGTPPTELSILPRVTEQRQFPRRRQLADLYADAAQRELPDLRFYVVFALWKMAILLEAHWARHLRRTAGTFDFTYLEAGGPIFHSYIRHVVEDPDIL